MSTQPTAIDHPITDWSSSWIWQQETGPTDTWMCFRHAFDLDKIPLTAPTKIAADSKYWLWINGKIVVREGQLKRGPTPNDTWFDELDLAPWLHAGKNQLAILVWYLGRHGFSHKDSGQGGLLFEATVGAKKIISDASWKARVHPSFSHAGDPQPNYRLPEHHIRFDARHELNGWVEPSYDDVTWPKAIAKGSAGAFPWGKLWPRSIPQWRDHGLRRFTNARDLITVADGRTVFGWMPYNAQVTPYIDIDAKAGETIVIKTDHYCGGGNGTEYNVRTEYLTKAGRQQFETPGWMNGHRIEFDIPAGVTIHDLRWRESGFDCDLSGSFACDDPFFIELWKKAQRTLYVTMRDTYFDCPDRERAQWWGDVVIELGETFYALDRRSDLLSRKAILDLVRWQRADGTLYSPIPDGNWGKELPPQMLAAISSGFSTYLLHSGDASVLAEIYPAVERYLQVWKLDEHDLPIHRSGEWDWGDWGDHVDLRLIDATWYALALRCAADYAVAIGRANHVEHFNQLLQRVTRAVQKRCWTPTGFKSPEHTGPIDDRGNAMAIISGIATDAQRPIIAEVLTTTRHASPYMEKYVLEALFLMNRADLAFRRMRERYAPMVESELSTLWEFWTHGGWGSTNHAWAGGPLTLLSQYAVGITPLEDGYASFLVRPQLGPLNWAAAAVPSQRGEILCRIERHHGALEIELSVPVSSQATVAIASIYGAIRGITVDGVPVANRSSHLRAPEQAADDIEFELGPGQWRARVMLG